MRTLFTAAALLVSATTSDASAPGRSYLCVADQATGFKWQADRWSAARFDPVPMKFLLRPIPPTSLDPLATHGVYRMGDSALHILCAPFPSAKDASLRCGYPGLSLLFVEGTMRFEYYFGVGYTAGGETEHSYTPHIAIGKCTVLD